MEEKWFERTLAVLGVIALCVILYLSFGAGKVNAATVCQIPNGCTGISTAPTYGQVLLGNSSGGYTLTATSSLGISGSGSSASSTLLTDNNTFAGNNVFSNLVTGSVSGNSGTATKLATPRGINGVNFDGSAAISINAASSTHLADNNTFSGNNIFSASTTFGAKINAQNATTTGLEITTNNLFADGYSSALLEVNSSHQFIAYAGAASCTNQFFTGLSALGASTCASVVSSDISGQIGLSAGGTNASLSGASGLVAMNSGNSALSIPSTSFTLSSILLTAPNASTTNLTVGTFFTVPNSSTAPTFTAAGQVQINTNSVASSSVSFGAASQNNSLFAVHSSGAMIASSTLAYLGAYGTAGTTTIRIANPLHSSTLVSFVCQTDIGTAYIVFGNGSASTTASQCTTGRTLITPVSNNTWTGSQTVYAAIGDEATSPNTISVTTNVEDSN